MNHSFTTKELPESERPYEKFWKYGATALSDAELLAIVIKSGSSKMTAVDVARSFLSQKDRNLMNLYEMSYDEMKKIHGIGDVIAMQLKCIAELSTRIANTRHFEGVHEAVPKSPGPSLLPDGHVPGNGPHPPRPG